VSTVRYGIPFTGTGAPVELGNAETDKWAQADRPSTGTAVWTPDHVPAATPTATDWQYADLTFADSDGRAVNTANYANGAWNISTTEYDDNGNTVRTLSAANRADALTPDPLTDPYVASIHDSAQRALLLSDLSTYDPDGVDLLDQLGPMHQAREDQLTTVRQHTVTRYDEGAPTGSPFHLPTTAIVSGQRIDGTDIDARVTKTGYEAVDTGDPTGWSLHQSTTTRTIIDPADSTKDIVTTTRYNAAGQAIESRMPSERTGGGAGTALTTYYGTGGTDPCGTKPQWVGLVCQTQAAGNASSGAVLPQTTTTYTVWDAPATVTDWVPQGPAPTQRATTTTYDPAGRVVTRSVSGSRAGAVVPAVTTGYDPHTGLVTGLTSGDGTIIIGYDNLGQARTYQQTDSTGAVVTTASKTYDIAGRVATAADGRGSTTYSYDNADDHRGNLVGSTDSLAGSFSARYDADGTLTTTTYPGGLTATTGLDSTGTAVSLAYTKDGTPWLSFSDDVDAQGQVTQATSPLSTEDYGYDVAGRLAKVDDLTGADCTERTYQYSVNANRTSSSVAHGAPADAGSATRCNLSTPATSTTYSYDTADRLQSGTDVHYDGLGRTTGLPGGAVTGGRAVSVDYYVNDIVSRISTASEDISYALDPTQDRQAVITGPAGTITTNHFTDPEADSPAWTSTSAGAWTRYVDGPNGQLACSTGADGTVELQLANLHGDIVATATPNGTAPAAYFESTEFGLPRDTNTANPRYAWLGAHQRDSANTSGGLVLMGVRLYDPTTGRFLSMDPEPGGSCNDYDYACGDPINRFDLDGKRWHFHCHWCGRAARSTYHFAGRHWRSWAWGLGSIGIVAGAGAVCGLSWGVACAAAGGIAYGALRYRFTHRHRTAGGYFRASLWQGIKSAASAAGRLYTTRWIGNAWRVPRVWHGYWARAAVHNLRRGWIRWQ
jgi:RHS repeat-associated protein